MNWVKIPIDDQKNYRLTIEGKKTVGLEIFAQNSFKAPDAILVPVGDGVIIGGAYKAFYDLKAAGLIARLPRFICVQAERSSAIHRYIETGRYRNAPNPATIADSISVSIPSNAHMARAAVLESGGFSVTVTDADFEAPGHPVRRKPPATESSVAC